MTTPQHFQRFCRDDIEPAAEFFKKYGYVVFEHFFSEGEIQQMLDAYEECERNGSLRWSQGSYDALNDAIFLHSTFEKFVKDPRVVSVAEALLCTDVELQQSKLNNKPLSESDQDAVPWHQDNPFFPHTNDDLLAILTHFDDEGEESGPIRVIPGSHVAGNLSHCKDGVFQYQCTEELDPTKAVTLTGKRGMVTIHHGLTLHASAPRRIGEQRRIMCYQYRARDAIQLAGALWKCTGYQVKEYSSRRRARFRDGSSIEVRGDRGQLYDIYGKLAPER